jgi:hypothetical protein
MLSSYAPPPVTPVSAGVITLTNYWVATYRARRGRTLAFGYVIDNGTGAMVRLFLGASIKATHTPSWATGTISDPAHDVVATVPPGTTTHVRFFSLSSDLQPGVYDVAWGLRDAITGRRVTLVTAPGVLRVEP